MVSTKASPRSVESHAHPKVPLSRKRMTRLTRAKARAERAQQAVASKNNDSPHVAIQDGLSMLSKLHEMERGGNMITTHHAPSAKKMSKISKASSNLPTRPKTPNTQQLPYTECSSDCRLPQQANTHNTQQVHFTPCGNDCCLSHQPNTSNTQQVHFTSCGVDQPVAYRIEFPSSPIPPPTPPTTPPTKVPPTKVTQGPKVSQPQAPQVPLGPKIPPPQVRFRPVNQGPKIPPPWGSHGPKVPPHTPGPKIPPNKVPRSPQVPHRTNRHGTFRVPSFSTSTAASGRELQERQRLLHRHRRRQERARAQAEARAERERRARRERLRASHGADRSIQARLQILLEEIPSLNNQHRYEFINQLPHADRIQLALMMPELFLNRENLNMLDIDPEFLFRFTSDGLLNRQVLLFSLRGVVQNIRGLESEVYRQGLRRSLPILIERLALLDPIDQSTAELIRYLVDLSEPLSAERIDRIASRNYNNGAVVLAAALERAGYYTIIVQPAPESQVILLPAPPPADDPERVAQTQAGEDLLLQLADIPDSDFEWTQLLFTISRGSVFRNIHGRMLYRAVMDDHPQTLWWLIHNNCRRSLQAVYLAIILDNRPLIRTLMETYDPRVPLEQQEQQDNELVNDIPPAPPFGFRPAFPPGRAPRPQILQQVPSVEEAIASIDVWAERGLPFAEAALRMGNQDLAAWFILYDNRPELGREAVPRWRPN
ncbi:hypothetical protein ABKA04_003735 [Annulohypoxylon sp. FPYF3050]